MYPVMVVDLIMHNEETKYIAKQIYKDMTYLKEII